MSTRKPHNNLAGYVAERKSRHPKLPGYFAIFDRNKGGDWVTGSDGERYGVAHIQPDDSMGCVVCVSSMPTARAVMVDMAEGGNVADLGQYNTEGDE